MTQTITEKLQICLLPRGRGNGLLQWQRSFFPLRFPKPDVCHGVPYIPPQVGKHRIFSCFFLWHKLNYWLFRPHGIDTALVEVPKKKQDKSQVMKTHSNSPGLTVKTADSSNTVTWSGLVKTSQDTIHSVTNLVTTSSSRSLWRNPQNIPDLGASNGLNCILC